MKEWVQQDCRCCHSTSRGEGPFMKSQSSDWTSRSTFFNSTEQIETAKLFCAGRCDGTKSYLFRQPSKLRRGTGSVWRCALLGAAADCGGSCRAADRPAICEAICEVQQERHQRCGGNLRSRRSSQHA